MSDYGLEVRDEIGNIIIDGSTFTVRQVAKRFISRADLILKTGRDTWTAPVQFPWAEAKYGQFISVTQLNLGQYPRDPTPAELATVVKAGDLSRPNVAHPLSLDGWLLNTPRLPVAKAWDGYITLEPAVYAFNADVWLSLYVVV